MYVRMSKKCGTPCVADHKDCQTIVRCQVKWRPHKIFTVYEFLYYGVWHSNFVHLNKIHQNRVKMLNFITAKNHYT